MGVVCTSSNKQKQIKVNEVIKAEPKPTEKPSSKENNEIDNKKNNNISNVSTKTDLCRAYVMYACAVLIGYFDPAAVYGSG